MPSDPQTVESVLAQNTVRSSELWSTVLSIGGLLMVAGTLSFAALEIDDLTDLITSKDRQIASLQTNAMAIEEQTPAAENSQLIERLTSRNDALQNRLDEQVKTLEEQNQENEDLKSQISRLNLEIRRLRRQLAMLNDQQGAGQRPPTTPGPIIE